MRIRFTKAARKHRIGRARVHHVIGTSTPEPSCTSTGHPAMKWVGEDSRGVELEILAIHKADRKTGENIILVIHVMPTALKERKTNE